MIKVKKRLKRFKKAEKIVLYGFLILFVAGIYSSITPSSHVLSTAVVNPPTPTPTISLSSGYAIIGGIVKDQQTGLGIANYQVLIEDGSTSKLLWVTTDQSGSYATSFSVKTGDIYAVRPQVYYGKQYCPPGYFCDQTKPAPYPWSYENQISGHSPDCGKNCNFSWPQYVPPTNTPTPSPTDTPTPTPTIAIPTPTLPPPPAGCTYSIANCSQNCSLQSGIMVCPACIPQLICPTETPVQLQQSQSIDINTNQIIVPTQTPLPPPITQSNPAGKTAVDQTIPNKKTNLQRVNKQPIEQGVQITPINMNVHTIPNYQFIYLSPPQQNSFSVIGFLVGINNSIKVFFSNLFSGFHKE